MEAILSARGRSPEPPYLWASKIALRRIKDDAEAPPATLRVCFGLCWLASDFADKESRPEFIASLDAIGVRMGLTRQTIGPCLPHLERMHLVEARQDHGFKSKYTFRLLSLERKHTTMASNLTALDDSHEGQIGRSSKNTERTRRNKGEEKVRTTPVSLLSGSEVLIITEANLDEIVTALILSKAYGDTVDLEGECRKFLTHQKAKGYPATLGGFFNHWLVPTELPPDEVHGFVRDFINSDPRE